MSRTFIISAACAGLLASSASALQVTFDLQNQPLAGQWNNASQTVGDFTLQGDANMGGIKRADTATNAYQGSFMFPLGFYSGNTSLIITNSAGVQMSFVLESINIETRHDDMVYEGLLGGVTNWTIVPSGNGFATHIWPTYTNATTGDMSLPIDEIQTLHTVNDWENRYDDLIVDILVVVPTVDITKITIEDVAGYSFTSIAGRTHRLQYSLEGINYIDTGVYVIGDGTEKVLVDPAPDTTGRMYRVTDQP